jgi:hypothetical protein
MYVCIKQWAEMRQFTMNIEDGLLLAAKSYAVATGRSMSDIVRDLLAREVGWSADRKPAPLDPDRARPLLEAYSEGRISRRQVMDALGLPPERHADFVDAMNRLAVPWPQPNREQIETEAEVVVRAIQGAADEN